MSFHLIYFCLCCMCCSIFIVKCDNDVIVNLPNLGLLRGNILHTRTGRQIFSFRGVRYAQSRRFSDPIPVQSWINIMNVTDTGYTCPQPNNKTHYSEDCLNLDIYSTNTTGIASVIVYIHGGAFMFGDKSHALPYYILDKDVVLVSINYRLGALGFFSTGTKEATGNYGLKDQVMALTWIKSNIKYFGGDRNSITIVGHSAGAVSATLHLISPMSRGLFNKAIIMSGAATLTSKFSMPELSSEFSKALNCSNNDMQIQIECLRKAPLEAIVENTEIGKIFSGVSWNYETESDFGQMKFLDRDPTLMFAEGNYLKIPIIIGITKDEFKYVSNDLLKSSKTLNELNENFEQFGPKVFQYSNGIKTETTVNVTNALRKFYFNNQNLSVNNSDKIGEFYSDSFINYPVHRLTKLIRKYTNLYFYRIDYIGRFSYDYKLNSGKANVFGTEILEDFDNTAPKYLMYGSKIDNSTKITELLKNFYLRDNSSKSIEELFSDSIIGFSVHRLANLAKLYTNVYYYRFDFLGRFSHVYDSMGNPSGIFHADDLQYIFVYDGSAPMFNKTDRENIMVERLTHWFTTFAATGNPNSNPNEWTSGIHWPASNATKLQTLYIDEQCFIGDEPYQNRFKLWDELFPIPT